VLILRQSCSQFLIGSTSYKVSLWDMINKQVVFTGDKPVYE
jgi:hypothetical protein